MRVRIGFLLLLVAATLVAVAPCSAQQRIEVTPFVGAYVPGGENSDAVQYGCGVDSICIDGTSVRQDKAVIGGAQLSAWFGEQVAAEVGFAFSPSGTATEVYNCSFPFFRTTCGTVTDMSAQVVTGSARVLFTFSPPTLRRPSLYAVFGLALFHRSGSGFQAAEDTVGTALPSSYWGPLFGVGVRMLTTPTVAPRAELVVALPGWKDPHGDLVLTLGLSRTLSGGRGKARSAQDRE